jgi:hypothetical protein
MASSGVHPPGPGSHQLIRQPVPVRHEEMPLIAAIEPCRSGDIARLLPLPRDAEEGGARILAALNDSAVVAYVAQRNSNDLAAAAAAGATL